MARRATFRVRPIPMVLLGLFAALTVCVSAGLPWVDSFNLAAAKIAYEMRASGLTAFFETVTHLGDALGVATLTVFAVLALIAKKKYSSAFFIVSSVVFSAAFTQLFKTIVRYPRPGATQFLVTAWGNAYPSGHTSATFAFWGALALILAAGATSRVAKIMLGIGAGIMIVLVGLSRIYLGVHWATDVLGSCFLVGAILYTLHDSWKSGQFDFLDARLLKEKNSL